MSGCTPVWTTQQPEVIKEFMLYIPTCVCERILSDDIEESKSLELLIFLVKQRKWYPNETISGGNTALHLACETNKLRAVEYLLSVNCSPNVRNGKGDTPINMTSSLDIIRLIARHNDVCPIDFLNNSIITEEQILQLINELPAYSKDGCNLIAVNCNGDTALHLACKTNRPTVVKFLLEECEIDWDINAKNCSGATPIQLSTNSGVIRELIRHGARPVELYSYCRRVLKTSKLLETAVKVFVIGDEDVGKSTLISSLQQEECFLIRIISYIKSLILKGQFHNTLIHHNVITGSGVLIDNFSSRSYGHVQLYDFVGDRLFHDSQSDLLKETEFSPRNFLIVINLNQEPEKMKMSIRYWLSFLQAVQSKLNMHVIVIGNQFDTFRSDVKTMVEVFLEKETPKFHNINYCDFIILDCRDPFSSGMSQLRYCLEVSCSTARNFNTMTFSTHCFQVYLLDNFHNSVAVTILDIQNRIEQDKQNVSATEPLFFLPYHSLRNLLKLCNELHQKGQILLLKSSENIEYSWVVINKNALNSHISHTIHSQLDPENLTNNGVLSLNAIASIEQFKIYNLEMLVNFLIHLEYFQEISDKEIIQLITKTQHLISSTNERWFFFPALVNCTFPKGLWKHVSYFTHYCGWILQCTNHEQFFTSQFLHVMILRVMFTFPVSTQSSTNVESSFVQRKCSIWRRGIFWGSQFGAESIVAMLPDNQSVLFMMRSLESNIIECVAHRSRVISKIRRCVKEFFPEMKVNESFINPKKLTEYPISITSMDLFDINSVAKGMINLRSLIISRTNSISLNGLLKFEPFAMLPASILSEICNQHNPRFICTLSNHFLIQLAENIIKNSLFLEVINCILHKYDNIIPSTHPCISQDRLYIKLVKWRDSHHITYQCLQRSLGQFSIFIGLNISDMVPSLVYENKDFKTPLSSPTTSRRCSAQFEGDINATESESQTESTLKNQHHHNDLQLDMRCHGILQSTYYWEAIVKAHIPFMHHIILECDYSGLKYTSEDHDITLKIPEGAVAKNQMIHIEFDVTMYGLFNFPKNTQPISPIVWLCILEEDAKLKKPFQLILPHFLLGLTKAKLCGHQVGFAKASHYKCTKEGNKITYEFKVYDSEPLITSSGKKLKSYAVLESEHCCFYCIKADKTRELIRDASYCLTRIERSASPQRNELYFIGTYFLKTCLQAIQEQFQAGNEYKISCHDHFQFEDETAPHIYIKFVPPSDGQCMIALEPSTAQIKATDIDFQSVSLEDMQLKHDLRMYPPRVKMAIAMTDRSPFILSVKVSGCSSENQLDTDILFPLESTPSIPNGSQLQLCQSHTIVTKDDTLKLKDVFQKLLPLSADWYNIGILLGIENNILREIRQNESQSRDRLREMLSEWLQMNNPPPTWNSLADAVKPFSQAHAQEIRDCIAE